MACIINQIKITSFFQSGLISKNSDMTVTFLTIFFFLDELIKKKKNPILIKNPPTVCCFIFPRLKLFFQSKPLANQVPQPVQLWSVTFTGEKNKIIQWKGCVNNLTFYYESATTVSLFLVICGSNRWKNKYCLSLWSKATADESAPFGRDSTSTHEWLEVFIESKAGHDNEPPYWELGSESSYNIQHSQLWHLPLWCHLGNTADLPPSCRVSLDDHLLLGLDKQKEDNFM